MTKPWTYDEGRDLEGWIVAVDKYIETHVVPNHLAFARDHVAHRVDACVQSLTDPLQRIRGRPWIWTWPKYKVALREIKEQIRRGRLLMALKIASVVGIGLTACVAGPLLLAAGLGAVGFSSVGVVGGSIAAGIQSSVYGAAVTSGSAFAFCQSFAMGGAAAAAAVTGVSGAAATGISAAAVTINEIASKPSSRSWDDGDDFRPSKELLQSLLNLDDDDEDEDDGAVHVVVKLRIRLESLGERRRRRRQKRRQRQRQRQRRQRQRQRQRQ